MLMPSVFGENLFDDFMDGFAFPTGRSFFEMPAQNVLKTDIKETENGYELAVEMPGYNKDDIKAQLKDGYLTIGASVEKNNDQKDENGRYLRKERYSGSVSRSFYVGESVKEEDIHAKFDNGVLTVDIPKEEPAKAVEAKTISIEG